MFSSTIFENTENKNIKCGYCNNKIKFKEKFLFFAEVNSRTGEAEINYYICNKCEEGKECFEEFEQDVYLSDSVGLDQY